MPDADHDDYLANKHALDDNGYDEDTIIDILQGGGCPWCSRTDTHEHVRIVHRYVPEDVGS
jgi:hypothetical protein